MRFTKFASRYWFDVIFLGSVVLFGLLYYVVAMTPGKATWYRALAHEWHVALHGLLTLL